jgi:hypothetical protein
MNKTILAVTLTALLQVTAIAGLVTYLYDHADDKAYSYGLTAESNAIKQSREDILKMYQTIQDERNADRDEYHRWVDRQISLRLTRANLPTGEVK